MNLKLSKPKENADRLVYYPQRKNFVRRLYETSLLTNLDLPWDLLDNHLDYSDRIDEHFDDEELKNLTLEKLYENKGKSGNLLDS